MMNVPKLNYNGALNRNRTIIFCLFFSINYFISFSQQNDTNTDREGHLAVKYRKNELKIGALKMVTVPMLDLEYERAFNRYGSFGGSMWISFDKDKVEARFSISPFFRIYFTESREYGSKGFFAQISTGYYSGRADEYSSLLSTKKRDRNFNSLGVGFGVGWKWINKGGFLLQVLMGINRTISDRDVAPDFVPQGGIYVGYRF